MGRIMDYLPRIVEIVGACAVIWAIGDLFGVTVAVLAAGAAAIGAAFFVEA